MVFSVLLISFSFAILSLSLLTSISRTNAEWLLDTYGEWYLSFTEETGRDGQWIREQPWVSGVGTATICGELETLENAPGLGLGLIDDELKRCGHIRLDEGRWPETPDEIAIESSTLQMMEYEPVIGQEIQVTFDTVRGDIDRQETFTVCGIIHEYTRIWRMQGDDKGTKLRGLICAVITPEAAERILGGSPDALGARRYFVSSHREDRQSIVMETIQYFKDTRSQDDLSKLVPYRNDAAFLSKYEEQQISLYTYMIAGVALLAVLCAYIMQLPTEIRSFATLRSIGITKPQLAALLLTESALLSLPAMLMGVPLGMGLTWVFLRLLMYSGSVPIQVYVPYARILTVAALWLLMVLVSRFIVFLVTVHTPLVGRFQLDAAKSRRTRRFRQALIGCLLVSLGFVLTYSTLAAFPYIDNVLWWRSFPAYHFGQPRLKEEDLRQMEQIPGVVDAEGLAQVPGIGECVIGRYKNMWITLSFEGYDQKIHLSVVDDEAWADIFSMGDRQEAFRNGEFCYMTMPKYPPQEYLLPEGPVTLRLERYEDGEVQVQAISAPTEVSVFWVPRVFFNRGLTGFDLPYTIVCSHTYLKTLIDSMEPGTSWGGFVSGDPYRYQDVMVTVDINARDLSTEVALAKYSKEKDILYISYFEDILAQIQKNSQKAILICAGGGSITLVLLLILGSTISLETEQEKRRYGILRTLGMSRQQMWRDILGRGLGRTVLAVLGGLIAANMVTIEETLYMLEVTLLIFGSGVIVVLLVCLMGKRVLIRGENKN